ncbi:MAG: hypothetical protein LBN39_03015 [Planctomycetaceae bacterium]|jgi:hypothetical protein|nr:hypothetical protein [Planctomycetaceae bacterium]
MPYAIGIILKPAHGLQRIISSLKKRGLLIRNGGKTTGHWTMIHNNGQ